MLESMGRALELMGVHTTQWGCAHVVGVHWSRWGCIRHDGGAYKAVEVRMTLLGVYDTTEMRTM
jgi:hypothetical protein